MGEAPVFLLTPVQYDSQRPTLHRRVENQSAWSNPQIEDGKSPWVMHGCCLRLKNEGDAAYMVWRMGVIIIVWASVQAAYNLGGPNVVLT